MGYNPQWVQWIQADAPRYGIDPQAALAIASHEGLSGAVGDGGHAFGPFQLNDAGGVLTNRPGDHRSFAESRAGVQWALQQMAAAGAKGLTGKSAVQTIASKFERPANVAGEISDAWSRYGKVGATTGSVNSSPTGNLPLGTGGAQGTTGAAVGDPKQAMAAMLLQSVQGGGQLNPNSLLQMAQLRQQQNAAQQTYGPTPTNGSLISPGPHAAKANSVVSMTQQYLGTPYVWGGESPKGFDCSGLLQFVWGKNGVNIPRTTYDQFKTGQTVGKNQLTPGDAVFFRGSDSKNGLPGHVGMYIGNGHFIEAPHTGAKVQVSNLAGRSDYMGARRYA